MSQIFTFIEAKPGQMPPEGWVGNIQVNLTDNTSLLLADHSANVIQTIIAQNRTESVLWAKDITEEVRESVEAYKSELRSYDDYDKVKDTVERLIEINPLIQSMETYLK